MCTARGSNMCTKRGTNMCTARGSNMSTVRGFNMCTTRGSNMCTARGSKGCTAPEVPCYSMLKYTQQSGSETVSAPAIQYLCQLKDRWLIYWWIKPISTLPASLHISNSSERIRCLSVSCHISPSLGQVRSLDPNDLSAHLQILGKGIVIEEGNGKNNQNFDSYGVGCNPPQPGICCSSSSKAQRTTSMITE